MAIQVERLWEFMAKGLDFGLGLWRLHIVPARTLQFLYFIELGNFSPFFWTLNKVFSIQCHDLSTWTTIV
jgi:hypothetical protein